jgi:TRAP-type C4-dicarboxylate transport system permease small subunit
MQPSIKALGREVCAVLYGRGRSSVDRQNSSAGRLVSAPESSIREQIASSWRPKLRQAEDWIPVLCFGTMLVLPLLEASLRKLFNTGIAASASLVQHCCLVLGMVGGAIAARDQRLLSLSTISTFLKGRAKSGAQLFSHSFGAGICIVLAVASCQFMLQEKAAGGAVAYGIKRWMVETCMPLGFGVIAGRLLWHASSSWKGRMFASCVAAALVAAAHGSYPEREPCGSGVAPACAAALLGTPVFVVLGGAAVILFWGKDQPLSVRNRSLWPGCQRHLAHDSPVYTGRILPGSRWRFPTFGPCV